MNGRPRLATIVCAGLAVVALELTASHAAPQEGARPAPEWVAKYFKAMTGTWVADNSAYKSDTEPIDAYGMDWKPGLGGATLVGRLYGLRDGKEVATYWEFREYWHPGEGELIAAQFGGTGVYGAGPHRRKDGGAMEMVQTFYDPAGTVTRTGHRSTLTATELTTQSFDVGPDGVWKPRRTYVWKRKG